MQSNLTEAVAALMPGLKDDLARLVAIPSVSALPAHAVGYVYLPAAICVAMASVLAAPLGTRIAHAISGPMLKRVFALFLLAVGASLLLP